MSSDWLASIAFGMYIFARSSNTSGVPLVYAHKTAGFFGANQMFSICVTGD